MSEETITPNQNQTPIQPQPEPTPSKSNNILGYILFTVLGLLLLGGSAYGGYWYGTRSSNLENQTSKPQLKTQGEEVSNWKTYTSTYAGFKIQHPEDWVEYDVGQLRNNTAPIQPLSEGKWFKKGTIAIQFGPPSKSVASLDDWLDSILEEYRAMSDGLYYRYKSKTETKIAGYDALKIEAEDPGGRMYITDYLIRDTLTTRGVQMSIFYSYNEINEQKELINQILSTFKFLNTDSPQSCIEEWEAKKLGSYAPGDLFVTFFDGVTEAVAIEIIKSYGLNLDLRNYAKFSGVGHVKVKPGTEFEWICKLQQGPGIKHANPSPISFPTD